METEKGWFSGLLYAGARAEIKLAVITFFGRSQCQKNSIDYYKSELS